MAATVEMLALLVAGNSIDGLSHGCNCGNVSSTCGCEFYPWPFALLEMWKCELYF